MPPRRRDWTEGTPQVGIFIRTADGGTVQWVNDRASQRELEAALDIISGSWGPKDGSS